MSHISSILWWRKFSWHEPRDSFTRSLTLLICYSEERERKREGLMEKWLLRQGQVWFWVCSGWWVLETDEKIHDSQATAGVDSPDWVRRTVERRPLQFFVLTLDHQNDIVVCLSKISHEKLGSGTTHPLARKRVQTSQKMLPSQIKFSGGEQSSSGFCLVVIPTHSLIVESTKLLDDRAKGLWKSNLKWFLVRKLSSFIYGSFHPSALPEGSVEESGCSQ